MVVSNVSLVLECIGSVIVELVWVCDPSVAGQLQPLSLHGSWKAQAMHAQTVSRQIVMARAANR